MVRQRHGNTLATRTSDVRKPISELKRDDLVSRILQLLATEVGHTIQFY